MASAQVLVGMGEIQTTQGEQQLSVLGVGSGVVVAAYDQESEIGACGHFILPEPPQGVEHSRPGKYAQGGLTMLVKAMTEMGAASKNIRTAIVGGAGVVSHQSEEGTDLGSRNVAATLRAMEQLGIRCMAQDVGGRAGRSLTFCVKSGTVRVRSGHEADHILCRLRGR